MNGLIGLIGNIIALGIIIFAFKIFYSKKRRLDKKSKKIIPRNLSIIILEWCNIRYNNLFTSILLPISLSVGYWYFVKCILKLSESKSYTIYEKVNSIILAPAIEEIFFRGIILAIIVLILFYLFFNKLMWKKSWAKINAYTIGLLLISIIFSLFHEGKLDLRYIFGVILGFVYLFDKKNLLPAIIAHTLSNILIIYFNFCVF